MKFGVVDACLCSQSCSVNDIHNRYKQDLQNFDGNAQALRVLSKLHFIDSDKGFNLTSALLNTIIKYPSSSEEIEKGDNKEKSLRAQGGAACRKAYERAGD